jgi:hypothetical protein
MKVFKKGSKYKTENVKNLHILHDWVKYPFLCDTVFEAKNLKITGRF